MKLILFDLDHTLLSGDSDVLWCEYLINRGVLEKQSFAYMNAQIDAGYRAGTVEPKAFSDFYAGTLAGGSPAHWEPFRRAFVTEIIHPRICKSALDLVRKHMVVGSRVVMTTATNRYLAEPSAKYLGIEEVIATELEVEGGIFTGRTTGHPNMREGKVTRLNAWLIGQDLRLRDFESSAYSDSINDLPLLLSVNHPVAIDPDDRLRQEAQRRGWPIVHLER
jgi:HAD superfamily hydrolase (TIGR01490 family)